MPRRLLMLFAETPLHVGGSESTGVVDLPIQREAATGLPVIWGQSLKGALRDAAHDAADWDAQSEHAVFGSAPPGSASESGADDGDGSGSLARGAVAVGDAQLLLFPAPTMVNTFAWVTSPMLLARLARKAALTGMELGDTLDLGRSPDGGLLTGPGWTGRQVLGPFVRDARECSAVPRVGHTLGKLAFPAGEPFGYARGKLAGDLLVADDTTLGGLAESGTEVQPRVQLDTDSKTVNHGPFYSEYLPAETVLAAVLHGPDDWLDKLTALLDGTALQVGGDETIGKGVVWCRVHTGTPVTPAPASESAGVTG